MKFEESTIIYTMAVTVLQYLDTLTVPVTEWTETTRSGGGSRPA